MGSASEGIVDIAGNAFEIVKETEVYRCPQSGATARLVK